MKHLEDELREKNNETRKLEEAKRELERKIDKISTELSWTKSIKSTVDEQLSAITEWFSILEKQIKELMKDIWDK